MIRKIIKQLSVLFSSNNPVFKSLALKMNLSVLIVMLSITGLFAVVLIFFENKRFDSGLEQTRLLLQTLKESEQPTLLSDIQNVEARFVADKALAVYALSIKQKINDLQDVRIISAVDGRQIAASAENTIWPVPGLERIVRLVTEDKKGRYLLSGDNSMHYFTALNQVGTTKGYLYLKYDLTPLYRASQYNFLIALAAILLMLAAVVGVLTYLNKLLVINPVLRISEGMSAVSQGDFLKKIDLKISDEIGLVAKSFNGMVTALYGFTRYVSRDVVRIILDSGNVKIKGSSKKVVVFFSDIRNFTSLTETNSPADLLQMLNSYFETMVPIINKCGGRLDKFIGDAIMADWGGLSSTGDDAGNACRSALLQRRALQEYNEKRQAENKFNISIGIGINMGLAIAGTIGSEEKMDYTVIGDTINLGSRLEGLTKEYGTDIIVSEDVVKEAGPDFVFRELDKVAVKGKKQGVRIYELVMLETELSTAKREKINTYAEALALYYKREFQAAQDKLAALGETYPDPAAQRLKKMIAVCIDNPPPADWDGTSVKTSK